MGMTGLMHIIAGARSSHIRRHADRFDPAPDNDEAFAVTPTPPYTQIHSPENERTLFVAQRTPTLRQPDSALRSDGGR